MAQSPREGGSILHVRVAQSPPEWRLSGSEIFTDEPMLYMAGMIDTFTDKDGKPKDAFVILTTAANASMARFHDRMPVILSPNEREDWIKNEAFMRKVLEREGPELEWKTAS